MRLTFTVPANAEPGADHLQIRATDGTVLASLPVTVTAAAVGAPAVIAATGANTVPAVLIALLALGCGLAFMTVPRRRMVELP